MTTSDGARSRPTPGPGEWVVGLSGWVIEDGNYPDFEVGRTERFAVEFFAPRGAALSPSKLARRAVRHLGESRYEINAELLFADEAVEVLDFGLVAYRETRDLPRLTSPWYAGVVDVGVDPFFYLESHARRPGVPPAIYEWDITGLWLQMAPFVTVEEQGSRRMAIRDPARMAWKAVDRTDAWHEGDGNAEYLVRCRTLDARPSRDIRRP